MLWRPALFLVAFLSLSVILINQGTHAEEPPNPIDPSNGELSLLSVVNSIPLNDIAKALDNFPVPYVVVAEAGGAAPQIFNNKAGVPTNVDADRSKSTGKGGHDVVIEVNTQVFVEGSKTELLPFPRLVLKVTRLGNAPYAQDLSVLIGFPFDAFNTESLDPAPNLFVGYETTAPGGASGGFAPLVETFTFTPEVLAGLTHTFSLNMATTGSSNPLRFFAGSFDGTGGEGGTGVVNVSAIAAHTEPVPATIKVGLEVDANALLEPEGADSFFDVFWEASAQSKVTFTYIEDETGIPDLSNPADYTTALVVDQMPTEEHLTIDIEEDNNSLTIGHRANSTIDSLTLTHKRADGFVMSGVASDIPSAMDFNIETDPTLTIDVCPIDSGPVCLPGEAPNQLDFDLYAIKLGGFINSSAFFGYDIGYLSVGLTDAPDLVAEWQPGDNRYQVQAANAGESIGRAEMVLDDGPVAVDNGLADVNRDGAFDGDDDGTLSGVDFIDGMADINGDAAVDASDDGDFESPVPSDASVIDGLIDLNGDGSVDAEDTGLLTLLQLSPNWSDTTRHNLSLVDDGGQGTVAGRIVTLSEGALDLDGPAVIDGMLDLDGNGSIDASDDGTVAANRAVIDGKMDFDESGTVDGADDGREFGREIIDGMIDLTDDGVVNGSDDGLLQTQTFLVGTTAASPMQAHLRTAATSQFFPGRKINATCDVNDFPTGEVRFQVVFPPPTINFNYTIDPPQGIDEVSCSGNVDNVHFELLAQDLPDGYFEFDYDPDAHLKVEAEDGVSGANSDTVGALVLRLCDDPDEDLDCDDDEGTPIGLPGTSDLFGIPLRDARARADEIPSFAGTWSDGSVTLIDGKVDINASSGIDGSDDGTFAGVKIIDGMADVNGDGSVTGSDDGRLAGRRVTNGLVDRDGDGDIDANDDGAISGSHIKFDTGVPDATLYIDGIQVAASTEIGLDVLPVADSSADDYLNFTDLGSTDEKTLEAGIFGIDEFGYSSNDDQQYVTAHYNANESHRLEATFDSAFGGKYFPDYETDLTLVIDEVPATMDFASDLATEFIFAASSGISEVTLDGTVDDTNDSNDTNGTSVSVLLDTLPASATVFVEGDARPVIDGKLNVKSPAGIDAADDDIFAGVRIIDGMVDLNGDGIANASDDGTLVGVAVIDGLLDIDASGAVDGDDDGKLGGATVDMSAAIELVSLELTSTNKVIKTDYQLIDLEVEDIPGKWVLSFGGERFLLESKTPGGSPSPLTRLEGVVSTSSNAVTNAAKIEPFTLDGAALGGPILGGTSGGCRVNYSEFTQEIDKRYYNAAPDTDPSNVFPRLREIYCDSEQLDPGEDHVVARMEDIDGDGNKEEVGYVSLKFTNFQHISWTPDDKGGRFVFRNPVAGVHPVFGGLEQDGNFLTAQIANIPDEIVVDFDEDTHLTYDASDDTDASVQEIDVYYGPLPTAADGDTAIRAVLSFPSAVVATTDFVHIGWDLGFPDGGAYFNSSEEFEIGVLYQDGSNRLLGGLRMEDLEAAWGLSLFEFNETDSIGFEVPYPCPELDDPFKICYEDVSVPIEWSVVTYEAGIDNDADDESLSLPLNGHNAGKTTIDGFFAMHERRSGIEDLTPASGVSFAGTEFVPFITAEGEGFGIGHVGVGVYLDPVYPDGLCIYPACVHIDGPTISGDITLDIWSNVLTNLTIGPFEDPITETEIIPEIGFRNQPDYKENDPFHILPADGLEISLEPGTWVVNFDGLHTFGDHFDPYAP